MEFGKQHDTTGGSSNKQSVT